MSGWEERYWQLSAKYDELGLKGQGIIDRQIKHITALEAENERLRELLNAWTELAREHLDTELAGRTFAALAGTTGT